MWSFVYLAESIYPSFTVKNCYSVSESLLEDYHALPWGSYLQALNPETWNRLTL